MSTLRLIKRRSEGDDEARLGWVQVSRRQIYVCSTCGGPAKAILAYCAALTILKRSRFTKFDNPREVHNATSNEHRSAQEGQLRGKSFWISRLVQKAAFPLRNIPRANATQASISGAFQGWRHMFLCIREKYLAVFGKQAFSNYLWNAEYVASCSPSRLFSTRERLSPHWPCIACMLDV